MSYREEDFAEILFAWPAVEGRITHLYELDPTHVIVQAADVVPALGTCSAKRIVSVHSSTSTPLCVLTDTAPAGVLLELDPTHVHVC